jgi:hypothetical protein
MGRRIVAWSLALAVLGTGLRLAPGAPRPRRAVPDEMTAPPPGGPGCPASA